MRTRKSSVLTAFAACGGVACLCGVLSAQQMAKPSKTVFAENYRGWFKVNAKRVKFDAAPAWMCAAPNASQMPSPHLAKFITVYVNPVGKAAMLEQSHPKFPVGTVIVKEKYTTGVSKTPELMTVMRKHEKGYNPDNGDWEYLALAGDSRQVQAQGKIETCQSCHQQVVGNDYVFRSPYLSKAQCKKLKLDIQ